ncbi:synapse differentiation-inducing gene protein 1-like [Ylistrum balloti]|uniref:synapse differentiation-inducing gene protein 1-like n=1 Tax=Ylistrum balloti TaxID=509963 RepID=UPI002905DD89|nr:synapse differentiation-inducing gene protein 1-like [Ylistrum balloti]
MAEKSGFAQHSAPPPYTEQGHAHVGPKPQYGPQPTGSYGQPMNNTTWAHPSYQAQFQQQQMVTSNVIVTQQPGLQPVIMAPPPEDNMVRAIIATFFCFWPIGMFAIWKAMESKSAYNRGDLAMAHANANSARQLANVAIGIGAGCIFAVIVYIIVLYSIIL